MSDSVNQARSFEVLTATPVRTRRKPRDWSDDDKARLIAEALLPGANVSAIARSIDTLGDCLRERVKYYPKPPARTAQLGRMMMQVSFKNIGCVQHIRQVEVVIVTNRPRMPCVVNSRQKQVVVKPVSCQILSLPLFTTSFCRPVGV